MIETFKIEKMDDDSYDLGHGFSQKAKHSRENLSKKSINSTSNPIKPFCFYQSIFEILASGDELVYEDYADEDELEENEQTELAESNVDEDEHKCYFEGAGGGEGKNKPHSCNFVPSMPSLLLENLFVIKKYCVFVFLFFRAATSSRDTIRLTIIV